MKLEDQFVIEAPTHVVWKFFLDIPQVATCVPGVEIVDQLDEENINVILAIKVGPIKAKFNGKVSITDLDPPNRLTARGEGRDANTASMVSATFSAILSDVDKNKTAVNYSVDVVIRGKLGQFGQGVIRATAKRITSVFVECVQEKVGIQS
tara:strand:- start:33 stop:485 length:453 start_codon:yes stop_codon:yes gene_type:complete